MFLVNLRHCADIIDSVLHDAAVAGDARTLAQQIDDAVQNYGEIGREV